MRGHGIRAFAVELPAPTVNRKIRKIEEAKTRGSRSRAGGMPAKAGVWSAH